MTMPLHRSALSASLFIFCLLFTLAGPAAADAQPVSAYDFPTITGNIVKAVRYTDATGDNLVLLTEKSVFTESENDSCQDVSGRELFAYRCLLEKDGGLRQIWRVTDYVRDCDLDGLDVFFIDDAFQITDLNNNGEAEIWLGYIVNCAGDPGPKSMKIIMYEGGQKYAVRGQTRSRATQTEYAGGEYKLDAAFNSGPAEFSAFAEELWEKHKNR